jgi:hypothetical protein
VEIKIIDNVTIVAVVALVCAVVVVALVFGRSLNFRGDGELIEIRTGADGNPAVPVSIEKVDR